MLTIFVWPGTARSVLYIQHMLSVMTIVTVGNNSSLLWRHIAGGQVTVMCVTHGLINLRSDDDSINAIQLWNSVSSGELSWQQHHLLAPYVYIIESCLDLRLVKIWWYAGKITPNATKFDTLYPVLCTYKQVQKQMVLAHASLWVYGTLFIWIWWKLQWILEKIVLYMHRNIIFSNTNQVPPRRSHVFVPRWLCPSFAGCISECALASLNSSRSIGIK